MFPREEEMRAQLAEQQQLKNKWISKIETTSARRIGSEEQDSREFSEDVFQAFKVDYTFEDLKVFEFKRFDSGQDFLQGIFRSRIPALSTTLSPPRERWPCDGGATPKGPAHPLRRTKSLFVKIKRAHHLWIRTSSF
jgi:hypothetical protein